ncbi:hypothetical protein ANO14919_082440 [Xylariales sp. No.14919]|nr:hypothetical protein ANO14919_082440 [Xylariales sp. No.14919]
MWGYVFSKKRCYRVTVIRPGESRGDDAAEKEVIQPLSSTAVNTVDGPSSAPSIWNAMCGHIQRRSPLYVIVGRHLRDAIC